MYVSIADTSSSNTAHTIRLQLVAEFSLSSSNQHVSPTQHAWTPHSPPASDKVSFVHSLKTMLGNGGPMSSEGIAIHLYACNADMVQEAFVNSDGDFLIVPVHGRLDIQTEFGKCVRSVLHRPWAKVLIMTP